MPTEQEVACGRDYVRVVLESYVSIPGTPLRPRRDDRFVALELYRREVALQEVEAALLLGCARRTFREPEEALQPIRSLRYFVPVIEEVRQEGVDPAYVRYLRGKLSSVLAQKARIRQQAKARLGARLRAPTARPARQLSFAFDGKGVATGRKRVLR
jgi:hypothetical protein